MDMAVGYVIHIHDAANGIAFTFLLFQRYFVAEVVVFGSVCNV
jgi:hypothetical protein